MVASLAPQSSIADVAAAPTRAALPRARTRRARNLVVLRAGDGSLHADWIAGARRDFDLFVSYYGETPGRYATDADFYEARPGPKWPRIADLLREHAGVVAEYDCVWFPDDDLATDTATIDRMFAFFHAHRLCLAQPALTRDSFCQWRTLLQEPDCHLRYGRFVEIMAPIFSRDALRACAPSFDESPSGWGLDWLWPVLCDRAGLDGVAVIDATPVRHTRPCGGELYRRHPDLDPRGDALRVVGKYGLHEQRAAARWTFGPRVHETPLPVARRLFYWLRRVNGRRRLRADA